MGPDRLSPLDASFLHIEDGVSHMHIGSVAIFEGPPPPYADVVEMVESKLDLVPRYRQKVRFVPLELGRPVWVDDLHFNIEYHLRHTALPAPGARPSCGGWSGGSWRSSSTAEAAVGDLGRRGARGRALGDGGQDAPRARRRRVGDGPVGGDHGPEPYGVTSRAPFAVVGATPSRRGPSSWWRRWSIGAVALRAVAGGPGADPRRVRRAAGQLGEVASGVFALAVCAAAAALEPQRADRAASSVRLGDDDGGRHPRGAQAARGHVQRRRAGVHHQRLP